MKSEIFACLGSGYSCIVAVLNNFSFSQECQSLLTRYMINDSVNV